MANLLHNFEVGWLARLDLTPFAFTVTGGVLVWGLLRERLLMLSPLVRSVIVETMTDGVFILDAIRTGSRCQPRRRPAARHLPRHPDRPPAQRRPPRHATGAHQGSQLRDQVPTEIVIGRGDAQHTHDVRREPLADKGGRPLGQLVVVRDITERARAAQTLERLLTERIAAGHRPASQTGRCADRAQGKSLL